MKMALIYQLQEWAVIIDETHSEQSLTDFSSKYETLDSGDRHEVVTTLMQMGTH